MTLISHLLSWFAASLLLLEAVALFALARWPGLLSLAVVLLLPYLYPLLAFRLHQLLFPLKEGSYDLLAPNYNPWWGGHQIQLVYFACPFLEGLLRLVPGLYSAWLRCWGAQVGKRVYWTPNVQIDDRSLVRIGSDVLLGHKCHLISHVILPHKGRFSLLVKAIEIGDGAFIGAGSRLGPGVRVDPGVMLPVLSEGRLYQHFQEPAGRESATNSEVSETPKAQPASESASGPETGKAEKIGLPVYFESGLPLKDTHVASAPAEPFVEPSRQRFAEPTEPGEAAL